MILFSALSLQAQNGYTLRRAHKSYNKFAYASAIKAYRKVYRKHPSDSVSLRIATCYTKLNQPENAAAWYAKVQNESNLSASDYLVKEKE